MSGESTSPRAYSVSYSHRKDPQERDCSGRPRQRPMMRHMCPSMRIPGIPTPGTGARKVERRPLETVASTDPAPDRAIDWRPDWMAESDRKGTDKGSDCSWCCLSNGFVTTRLGCLRGAGYGSGGIPVSGERPRTDLLVSLHSTAHGLDEELHLTDATRTSWAPTRSSSRARPLARVPTCVCGSSRMASTCTSWVFPPFPRPTLPSTTARALSRGSSPRRESTRFTRCFTASLIEDKKPPKRTCGRRDGEPRQSSLA